MEGKDSLITSGYITHLWVLCVSIWGGLVSYFEKKEPFSWLTLFAHLLSASFAGMMTYYICESSGVSGSLTGVFCGVAAHMGTPALLKMKVIRQFLNRDDEGKK